MPARRSFLGTPSSTADLTSSWSDRPFNQKEFNMGHFLEKN
ncbi:hypothetical protein SLEP1_g50400 [Rubroshorea leprosula]|uniref:Uncharacterized protein n=1 Tax=Rubroshorea leprosula TaxID=152421 RepID=A0AAV5M1Y0_9ROSI|nr:hypothetical protein SLEP1_g50400 [Rubroshorea leprosula]